jgi:hypothetical protein
MLTVTSPYGLPAPSSGWFDAGASIQASVNSTVSGSVVTQFACSGWTGTGSVPASGSGNKAFPINQPQTSLGTETNIWFCPCNSWVSYALVVYLLLHEDGKFAEAPVWFSSLA